MPFLRHRYTAVRALFALLPLVLCSCGGAQTAVTPVVPAATAELVSVQLAPAASPAPPVPAPKSAWSGTDKLRYVFLFIGDGMGGNHVRAVSEALAADGRDALVFTAFPAQGEARTGTVDGDVTDSAASITAIASGEKTHTSVLGRNADGRPVETIAETLHRRGVRIGVLSTVALDQATPAGFYAHVPKRSQYDDIMRMLFASGFDYFAGGGFSGALDAAALAAESGYTLAVGEEAAAGAPAGPLVCVSAYPDSDGGMPYALDLQNDRAGMLRRYVALGISRLSAADDPAAPRGFLLAVEGGRIDHASHYHDAGDMYAELLDFDDAIREAVAFYEAHPHETLIVVTADHETGDLSLADGERALPFLQTQSCRWIDANVVPLFRENDTPFADALTRLCTLFPLAPLSEAETAYLSETYAHTLSEDLSKAKVRALYNGVYSPIVSAAEKLVMERAGLSYASFTHTGVNVPVYALGVGADAFIGEYENTELHAKLLALMEQYA